MDSNSPGGLADFFNNQWHTNAGVAAALVVTLVTAESLLVGGDAAWWVHLVIQALLLPLVFVTWWVLRQPPRTPKNKIGFLVSLASEDDSEASRLRQDFLNPLQRLIKSGESGKAFHFIQLPKRFAENIVDEEDALQARIKSRAHFMLYGQVRLRQIGGKEKHVIELEGIVTHKEIPQHLSKSLSTEFSELLPRRVQIDTENDLFSFQFTSEWAEVVAKYIIGVAAAISGDSGYAEQLYRDVLGRLDTKDRTFPVFQKLSDRLPNRIAELYEARANDAYRKWLDGSEPLPALIDEFHIDLQEARKYRTVPKDELKYLLAIDAFLHGRDIQAAIDFLKIPKGVNSKSKGLWHLNMAFLEGYQGDLKRSSTHYSEAAKCALEIDVLVQVEAFACRVLDFEPDACELLFCLGSFNRLVKGDRQQAIKDYESFLKHDCSSAYAKERKLAEKWITQLQVDLQNKSGP